MSLALQILQLLNAATPGIASLIAVFRKTDGTVTVINFLDQADATVDANMKQITDWMAAHPKGA
jgi:hypothetical protein